LKNTDVIRTQQQHCVIIKYTFMYAGFPVGENVDWEFSY